MTVDRNNSFVSPTSFGSGTLHAFDYNISQITPYLFVTAADSAQQLPNIFSNGIACVISVADELPQIVFPAQSGIESLKYPILDTPTFPASRYFDLVADRIAANVASNRRTLLYCHYGRSRSVTFTLAYLIKHHHLPLETAFALVKERRQLALPNVGFWSQLKSYELHQRQQHSLVPAVLRNLQDSVGYGQHMVHQITNGFSRAVAQIPIVNTTHRKTNFHVHHRHHLGRRPPVYLHPYHLRPPLRIRRPPLF